MALGRQQARQMDMLMTWAEMPRSPGHVFYDKLQAMLLGSDFDGFVEGIRAPFYVSGRGRPSPPPGRYFRMLLVGYFEGIDSERGLEWRCADSLSLRDFLRLGERELVPDHSWLSRTRGRLPLQLHEPVFSWVLRRLDEHGLIRGQRIGVDASTMEANAALRTIARRADGESYRDMLRRMAVESGIETPTSEDLIRLDRRRKGKTLSNAEWHSPTDPEARIARPKDGRTHFAYKPEHAVDLDTGAVLAAEMHEADQGDIATPPGTLASAAEHLAALGAAPTSTDPAELVADKGYHSRAGLKELEGGPWKSRIAEPWRDGFLRWQGNTAARRAVYNNRARLLSEVARQAFRLRAELVERSFALILDRGGMRRAWLRGCENVHKRYLIHVAGYNLGGVTEGSIGLQGRWNGHGGLLMRLLTGAGTPREFLARISVWLGVILAPNGVLIVILLARLPTSSSISKQTRSPETRLLQRAVTGRGSCP
jgi:transposase